MPAELDLITPWIADQPRFGWLQVICNRTGVSNMLPILDTRTHTLDTCWCDPRLTENGDYIHNSADGRELYEQGHKCPH